MYTELQSAASPHIFYQARRQEFASDDALSFRVSPEPFGLSETEVLDIGRIGVESAAFLSAANELYKTNEEVASLLDTGKPESLRGNGDGKYLFFRPDLIATERGYTVCELETSPFGLGLSHLLNGTYSAAGFETIVDPIVLVEHVAKSTPDNGSIVMSPKTASYKGQLEYMAENIFSGPDRVWDVKDVSDVRPEDNALYRAFYLHEYIGNTAIRGLLNNQHQVEFQPSLTPHMEEKALLALLWDSRFEGQLRSDLGNTGYDFLRTVVPPTWIVGQEQHFSGGLPTGVQESVDLAGVSRKNRNFVLKSSGFADNSSWSESVTLLQTKSSEIAGQLLYDASRDTQSLHIIQAFTPGKKVELRYEDPSTPDIEPIQMLGRIRLTPYFDPANGNLLTMKVTARENTHFIHASSDSINAPVMVQA